MKLKKKLSPVLQESRADQQLHGTHSLTWAGHFKVDLYSVFSMPSTVTGLNINQLSNNLLKAPQKSEGLSLIEKDTAPCLNRL